MDPALKQLNYAFQGSKQNRGFLTVFLPITFTHHVPDFGSTLGQRCPFTLDQCYEKGWIWKLDQRNIFNIGSTLGFQCWIDVILAILDQHQDFNVEPKLSNWLDLKNWINLIFATLDMVGVNIFI